MAYRAFPTQGQSERNLREYVVIPSHLLEQAFHVEAHSTFEARASLRKGAPELRSEPIVVVPTSYLVRYEGKR